MGSGLGARLFVRLRACILLRLLPADGVFVWLEERVLRDGDDGLARGSRRCVIFDEIDVEPFLLIRHLVLLIVLHKLFSSVFGSGGCARDLVAGLAGRRLLDDDERLLALALVPLECPGDGLEPVC